MGFKKFIVLLFCSLISTDLRQIILISKHFFMHVDDVGYHLMIPWLSYSKEFFEEYFWYKGLE